MTFSSPCKKAVKAVIHNLARYVNVAIGFNDFFKDVLLPFLQYFCPHCKLFDDEDKGQFHCDGCGLCRLGGRDNYFHCDVCNMCLPKSIQVSHRVLQITDDEWCLNFTFCLIIYAVRGKYVSLQLPCMLRRSSYIKGAMSNTSLPTSRTQELLWPTHQELSLLLPKLCSKSDRSNASLDGYATTNWRESNDWQIPGL